jgi:N-acetylneuraminic acid mutarotase
MLRIIWLATLALLLFDYCAQAQVWTARNPVLGRAGVYQFVINGVAYVGGGEDDQQAYADLYAYDPTADQWSPRAALPAVGRAVAATFVLGAQAYVVSGTTLSSSPQAQLLNDTWRYDPASDQWSVCAALPGPGRLGAAGFAIGSLGYVGGGIDFDAGQTFSDFYAYDPASNQWTSRAALPTPQTGLGAAFAFGSYGYVTGGLSAGAGGSFTFGQQTWRYDPTVNQWLRRADLPVPRAYCSALATGGFGYVTEGISNFFPIMPTRSTLRYDANADVWTTFMATGPGAARAVPVFFAVQNALYLGGGIEMDTDALLTDFWQLPGSVVTGRAVAIAPAVAFNVVPNPTTHAEYVRLLGVPAAALTVMDSRGRLVQSYPIAPATLKVRDLPAGLYLVRCGAFTCRLVVE